MNINFFLNLVIGIITAIIISYYFVPKCILHAIDSQKVRSYIYFYNGKCIKLIPYKISL
jgi:hypothetical protein